MLRRLKLVNIRKHEQTEIFFDEDDQLILLDGANETGKSTILEAILWAFYGETRHGHKRNRKGISGIVRRGAENEGATVECEFSVNDTVYEVTRRWEKGKSTAILNANGVATMRGADEVTKEMGRIFGVDANGFRLSAVAKQTDRDELTDLDPAKRRNAITRLLRHNTINTAAIAAREKYNQATNKAHALEAAIGNQNLEEIIKETKLEAKQTQNALKEAKKELAELDTQIGELANDAAAYHKQAQIAASLNAKADAKEEEAARNETAAIELNSTAIDPGEEPEKSLETINEEILELTTKIGQNQANVEKRNHKTSVETLLAQANTKLNEYKTQLKDETALNVELELMNATNAETENETKLADIRTQERENQKTVSELNAQLATLKEKLTNLNSLGSTCPTCEQTITGTHKTDATNTLLKEIEKVEEIKKEADTGLNETQKLVTTLTETQTKNKTHILTLRNKLAKVQQLETNLEQANTEIDIHTQTLQRLGTITVENVNDLLEKRTELETKRVEAQTWKNAKNMYELALENARAAKKLAETLTQEAIKAREEADKAKIDPTLETAATTHDTALKKRNEEAAFVAELAAGAATAASKVETAQERKKQVKELEKKLTKLRKEAEIASKAATALSATASAAAAAVGPTLEQEISTVLNELSDGRFSAAKVNKDYTITICDSDGSWQPVSEYSGGAIQLIGLAIRLALAKMIAGVGGVQGFLILDEVLGSQDLTRQTSILSGLRKLRSTYGQILLISHVVGVKDTVDRVIYVNSDSETGISSVT